MEKEKCIGIMSGTSLDGVDMALVELSTGKKGKWEHEFIECHTTPFPDKLIKMLHEPRYMSAQDLARTDRELGRFIGEAINEHFDLEKDPPSLIASHGHTIHHRPKRGLSFQIGYGGAIAAKTGIPTISDLRGMDLEYGGQGAPLAPLGDELLFSDHDKCLNLGGFANISYKKKKKRDGEDVCPVNTVLNLVCRDLGKEYDKDGKMAREGELDQEMLDALESLPFYRSEDRRSLGREWLEERFLPLIDRRLSPQDRLRTLVEHMAERIGEKLKETPGKKTLVTGGGAYNWFLIERIQEHAPKQKLVLPEERLIEYKEALIFALLGLLRWNGEINSLKDVTGADRDAINGAVYLPS